MSFIPTENHEGGISPGDFRFDNAAFKAFFQKHYRPLCLYCRLKYSFDIYMAEDIVTTGFVRLWETRQTLAAEISPKAYLYKIVDNLSLNTLRHEKVRQQHADYLLKTSPGETAPDSFESIDLKQLRSAIDAALSELPEQMRRVFQLRRDEGLKYAEIASRLNISVKTVDTQLRRALAKLKEHLSEYLGFYFIVLIPNWL
ncbi:RNA polymerase sigma-70 factor [Paraflavisolibacter sp. H34]|uniref:RNA polymerase sigma-70 factor n=1 Tax=Huijunlia imazamoxiresistens TaxID=3127457 RepID=UPI00301B126B